MGIEAIRNKTIFVGLMDGQLEKIDGLAEEVEFAKGEIILREHEPGDCLYVILEGKVEVKRTDTEDDGLLATLSGGGKLLLQYEGDFFGEMSVIDAEPRSATVSATENCRLLRFERDSLGELFKEDPGMHIAILGNIAKVLSHRLRTAIHKIICE